MVSRESHTNIARLVSASIQSTSGLVDLLQLTAMAPIEKTGPQLSDKY